MIFCSVFQPNPTFTTVKVTSLTPTRVVYVGASDELTDSANLTFVDPDLTCLGRLGVGVAANSSFGIYNISSAAGTISAGTRIEHTSQASSTARGVYLLLFHNRNGNIAQLTGVDFAPTFVPLAPTANRTCASMYGGNADLNCATEAGANFNSTVVSARGYFSRITASEAGGGTGVANVTTATGYYAATFVKGAGAITTAYSFYDQGQTAATTNWGCAINTQSYFNAAVSIGKNTAPTATNLNLAATYNIEKDTNDLTLTLAAQKTLVLSQPVWKDINLGAANVIAPSSGYPDSVQFKDEAGNDTGVDTYGFAVGEGISAQFEIQHDYLEGSDVTFHVHWQGIAAPAGGTDNVQWRLSYTITRDGQTMNVPTVIDSPDQAITAQYQCNRSSFAAIAGATGGYDGGLIRIGDQFVFNLSRVAATADEYGGDALMITAGIHYQIDTIGSRQISDK